MPVLVEPVPLVLPVEPVPVPPGPVKPVPPVLPVPVELELPGEEIWPAATRFWSMTRRRMLDI